jgi:hypothetical protein
MISNMAVSSKRRILADFCGDDRGIRLERIDAERCERRHRHHGERRQEQ